MGRHAAIYARDAQNPAHDSSWQASVCRDYCAEHAHTVVAEYCDPLTAAPDARPGFEELVRRVSSGDVDLVVCYSFERLVRTRQDLDVVRSELGRSGVAVECVDWGQRVH